MRTLIIEDHVMFRDALRRTCTRELGLQVVGEASAVNEASKLFTRLQPELVLLDLQLTESSGILLAKEFSLAIPLPLILVISAHCEDFTVLQLSGTQISGFIDKNASTLSTLSSAIKQIQMGEAYFCPRYMDSRKRLHSGRSPLLTMLSPRELELLPYLAHGSDDYEIASIAAISASTVKKHRSNILAKFNISSSAKLVARLHHMGYGSQ